jgi:alkaline phosphatase
MMSSPPTTGRHRTLVHVLLTIGSIIAVAFIAARFAPWEFSSGNLILRTQNGMTHEFPTPGSGQLVVPKTNRRGVDVAEELRPRNVILMIGDGMGVGQFSAGSMMLHGPDGELAVEAAPITGLVRTYAGNDLVTDSAAASTAMATGFKAPKTAISILADGRRPLTLLEAAKSSGLGTGVITTSGLADATPAGFLVHSEDRYQYAHIFSEILTTKNDILMGGTWIHHHKAKHDEEYLELVSRVVELGTAAGYQVVRDESDLAGARTPVLALFEPRGNSASAHGPKLAITTRFLLDALGGREAGFFALIESELSDETGHQNSISGVVEAVREFDEAVAYAVAWAEEHDDTLVLVTADHDTGGLGVTDGDYEDGKAGVRWVCDMHTGQWVPIFAFGPGAEHFSGVMDNTDIGVLIAKLLGIENFPNARP